MNNTLRYQACLPHLHRDSFKLRFHDLVLIDDFQSDLCIAKDRKPRRLNARVEIDAASRRTISLSIR